MCRKFLHSLTINQTQQKPHILQHYLFYVAFLFVYLQNKFINHERRRKKTI